jgi:MOSC domain-containing protein YiiM
MRVLSVNVGLPREVTWRSKPVRTGIYKEPVRGRVAVSTLNLAGDGQADLRVHGGRDKAVYAYSSEYYELWSRERPELELGPGTQREDQSRARQVRSSCLALCVSTLRVP